MMRAPAFWQKKSLPALALWPFSLAYAAVAACKRSIAKPARVPAKVICVGNAVAGGAGKTPVALWIGEQLKARGMKTAFLSRGYGGVWEGPQWVDVNKHSATETGDEPLLLARMLPTLVAKNRVAGAQAAAQNADVIVMDDGFQNPSIHKDFSLLVIDGDYGFGNGFCLPAGPLREPVSAALKSADAVLVVGEKRKITHPHVFYATLAPQDVTLVKARKVVAFAGIGRPAKFERTLQEAGAERVQFYAFPDHHVYSADELQQLASKAVRAGAELFTTEKDWVRLPHEWRPKIRAFPVKLQVENGEALTAMLHAA